jgi:Darcynin, domain of unknown function
MSKTRHTFFVHLRATKAWLSLAPNERETFTQRELGPIVERHPETTIDFYDAEAFTAKCSDIAVFETSSTTDYRSFMDELRDSKLFTVPYFEVVDIFPAIKADYI